MVRIKVGNWIWLQNFHEFLTECNSVAKGSKSVGISRLHQGHWLMGTKSMSEGLYDRLIASDGAWWGFDIARDLSLSHRTLLSDKHGDDSSFSSVVITSWSTKFLSKIMLGKCFLKVFHAPFGPWPYWEWWFFNFSPAQLRMVQTLVIWPLWYLAHGKTLWNASCCVILPSLLADIKAKPVTIWETEKSQGQMIDFNGGPTDPALLDKSRGTGARWDFPLDFCDLDWAVAVGCISEDCDGGDLVRSSALCASGDLTGLILLFSAWHGILGGETRSISAWCLLLPCGCNCNLCLIPGQSVRGSTTEGSSQMRIGWVVSTIIAILSWLVFHLP